MKVLQLITHLEPGGAQETVVLLAEGLRRDGVDVTVAARLGGVMEQRIAQAGVPLVDVPHLRREISPKDDALAAVEVDRLVARRGFDVVHTHSSKAGVLGRLAARRAKVPMIVHTSHGLPINPDMSSLERTALLAAERVAARVSHRIVAVSEATAQELLDLRLARREQLAVIPSGIDVDRFRNGPTSESAKRSFGLPGDALVAGWVGRHFPQKRPELVLEAARRVVREAPGTWFLMVGDGPGFDRAVASVADEPNIQVVGFRDDIETAYAAMDVFVLASAWEGLPRTVLEAGAAGVPVVATDVSGVREVVHDGVTGRLVPGDAGAIAGAIRGLLGDPAARSQMAERIRDTIDTRYSSAHTVRATTALYERAPRSGDRVIGPGGDPR